jgi:AcrR family transcriptional regulator
MSSSSTNRVSRANRTSQPSPPRMRAPRGTLNSEVIVAAAIAVIDRDGLGQLTTRRLAQELGVRPMSLYTHFRDKDAILLAVADELFGRFEMPESTDCYIEMLRRLMRSYFRLLADYPVLLQLHEIIDPVNPAEARISEAIHDHLRRLGFDQRATVGLKATLLRYATGCGFLYQTRRRWDEDPDHWESYRRRLAGLPSESFPAIHELTQDFPAFTQLEAFEFGLETLLTAIESTAPGDTDAGAQREGQG